MPSSRAEPSGDSVRKIITFDNKTWQALDLLSRESQRPLQKLADEAFADLLKKHQRPVTLKDALKASARQLAANDRSPTTSRPRKR